MLVAKRATCNVRHGMVRSRFKMMNIVKTGGNDENEKNKKFHSDYTTRLLVDKLNALIQVPSYQDIEVRDLVEVIWNKWHKNYKVEIKSNAGGGEDVMVKISWQIVDPKRNIHEEYQDVVTRLNEMKLGSRLLREIIDHETKKRFDFLMSDLIITLNVGEKGERLIEWD